jgi:methylglutaconyl-CoA hydratase
MSDDGISVVRDGDVLRVTIDRPARLNALDGAAVAALRSAFGDPGTARAVVLAGRGRSFCAGADTHWLERGASHEEMLGDSRSLHELLATVDGCPAPVLAVVQGHALGAGCALIACADIVVAHAGASFGLPETRVGLIPAIVTPFVVAKLGTGAGRRYCVTGETFDAATALRLGLVHEVCDDLLDGERAALDALLSAGPRAAREAKRLVRDRPDVEEQARRMVATRSEPEAQEGLAAFAQGREPGWSPRA